MLISAYMTAKFGNNNIQILSILLLCYISRCKNVYETQNKPISL